MSQPEIISGALKIPPTRGPSEKESTWSVNLAPQGVYSLWDTKFVGSPYAQDVQNY